MNSTPGMPASTMRLTALTPAPPTPTTRITGECGRGVLGKGLREAGLLRRGRGRLGCRFLDAVGAHVLALGLLFFHVEDRLALGGRLRPSLRRLLARRLGHHTRLVVAV